MHENVVIIHEFSTTKNLPTLHVTEETPPTPSVPPPLPPPGRTLIMALNVQENAVFIQCHEFSKQIFLPPSHTLPRSVVLLPRFASPPPPR